MTSERGQVAVMMTLVIIPLMAVMGLVTDLGYMNYINKSAQAAADSAALAAVTRFNTTIGGASFTCDQFAWICYSTPHPCPTGLTTAANPVESACLYAKQNGFSVDNSNQNVTVVTGVTATPDTAPGMNTAGWWITVRVSQKVPQLFSAVVGNTTGNVTARSTGAVSPGLGCVYALDPTASGAYYQNGNTNFNANCGILVDSNSSTAMYNSGNSNVSATSYEIVGSYTWHGSITPTPDTGVTTFPDPLRRLQPPSPCDSVTGCNSANCSTNPTQLVINVPSSTTVVPVPSGTYCGGIWVKKGTANFTGGTYIIVGGGITTQDTNSIVTGSNVFIYNTYNSSNAYGPINFNANSSVNLSAPNSGYYAGILAFQDRGCCATMTSETFQGGATSTYQGTIYFPESLVNFAGNPALGMSGGAYTIVVARRFAIQGTSTMSNDFSGVQGGNPIKQVGLVE